MCWSGSRERAASARINALGAPWHGVLARWSSIVPAVSTKPLHPLIDRRSAVELLRIASPEWEGFLVLLENAKGRLRFRSGLTRAIKNLKIENYPLLYESEQAIGAALLRAVVPADEVRAFDHALRQATPEERGLGILELGEAIAHLFDAMEFPDAPSAEQEAAVRAAFDLIPADQRAESTRLVQLVVAGALATFYEQLSLMVHGERMTSLVAQAKAGKDDAFIKAVQIDGRVLTELPYFRERYASARMSDETEFLDRVWRRQVAPPYKGRIEHKSLYLMFAFLDSVGLLKSFTHRELLDLYDQLSLSGKRRRIEDEKNMGKRLAEYRRFQNRRHVSTP